jgi:photosystem II oxygen-evolving enhancer protein 3
MVQAVGGTGAKFSFFGLTKGQATMYSEGAAYGTDQSKPLFSPYSQYSPVSEDSLAPKLNNIDFNKRIVNESARRLESNYEGIIASKKWMDVKAENTRFLYSLRKSMNELATTKEAKAAAKKVFLDLEEMTYTATVKDQAKCTAAWTAAKADMAAFKSVIGA